VRSILAVLALSLAMSACGSSQPATQTTGRPPAPARPAASPTRAAAVRFLDRYATSDGRVIRHDQGGDIVSEGQAYAMLIAEVAGRPAQVRTIWSWTHAHLGRSDGLFASHASGTGQLEDPHSATDADTLIAYALLRYTGPDQGALRQAGRRVADAVLAQESVSLPDGTSLPVAGPWAKSTTPPIVDPSYLMPSVFMGLAALTGDDRWNGAADASVRLIGGLTDSGTRLPPDWANLDHDRLVPIANPGGGAGVQYGFDAARLPIWFATACSAGARSIAAGWWRHVLGSGGRAGPQALGLDGATINPAPSPVFLMAGAAAAVAAGENSAASALRARAATLALEDPTYYGDAWVVLGPALLDGTIDPCARA
jgi:endo-1,4-beta-D-glucanase Y